MAHDGSAAPGGSGAYDGVRARPRPPRPDGRVTRLIAVIACGLALIALAGVLFTLNRQPDQDKIAAAQALATPDLSRANDWACKPAGKAPVVLVHGAGSGGRIPWLSMSPFLRKQGHCVFSLDYSWERPVRESGARLRTFVDGVLEATGAEKVSIVAHSLGGVVARAYTRLEEGASRVDDLITLGTPQHSYSPALSRQCGGHPFCADLRPGSELSRALNEPEMVDPGVSYTALGLKSEQEMADTGMKGPPEQVTNRLVHKDCPLRGLLPGAVGHTAELFDPAMLQYVNKALATPGPLPKTFKPDCLMIII
ncbi:esterase/lipase family protein [Bailinhaonella thermotolerans]|uniref:Alpha/beta fold hydrolase n=1 Tax=Bailinhaonella thermotolerans TaxID=1070861 RepID=A0A3A4A4V2_9ACTN|nr:alpha/beta fold hydrolase [Bailinhaonella thermotolerans]RJL20549.1 alpha/beta fold hydrolase [Bailinhaonella thermotolerans]